MGLDSDTALISISVPDPDPDPDLDPILVPISVLDPNADSNSQEEAPHVEAVTVLSHGAKKNLKRTKHKQTKSAIQKNKINLRSHINNIYVFLVSSPKSTQKHSHYTHTYTFASVCAQKT